MLINRRTAIKLLAGALPSLRVLRAGGADKQSIQIQPGPFTGTRESLREYRLPDWFRDAKFGIWAHWGPQSAAEFGDWYARFMYMEGTEQYRHHLEHYGHPSKVGFKEIIWSWKGELFDPDALVGLYKKAGAKYFVSMGVHHDNFDLWNSTYTRWNSVKMGPKKDIVGMFRQAALRHGLRFGVSDHLWISPKWFSVSHGSDKRGPYANIPYDGADPNYSDLYHEVTKIYTDLPWNEDGIPDSWKRVWFMRIKDLVDKYQPDLLYSDGPIPFEEWGLSLVAHFYNQNAKPRHGHVEAVYTSKRREDCQAGTCALDVERGVVEEILPEAWQTDTCIGDWHYKRGATYKTPKMIVDMLVDIVSKNGNLLLNFPLPESGRLDGEELKILSEVTRWMAINGEAIYGTRPWKIYGAGPNMQVSTANAMFNESKRKELTVDDMRFTTKGRTLYAFVMGWTQQPLRIPPLSTRSEYFAGRITGVELLGYSGKLQWTQGETGLKVQLPAEKPCDYAIVLKIDGA